MVARGSDAAAAALASVSRAVTGLGIQSYAIARGTATGADSELGRQSAAAAGAVRRAEVALSRAAQAARQAALEAAAEEERARRTRQGR